MYLIYALLATAACAQTTIDPAVLADIFGSPSPPPDTDSSTQRLEDITVRPTDGTTTFVDKNGAPCKCVPYYLCDAELNAVDANNASVTGWGTLDIRFREDDCQESTERCCNEPKTEEEVVVPSRPPPVQGCGYRNPNGLDFMITGGTGREAQFGEFPWVVVILDARSSSYVGVGVLIHPQVVMTGAHIVSNYSYNPYDLKIRAGEWDTQTVKERLKHQERGVKEMLIHPEFKPKSLKNDMALLLLEEPVQLAQHINIICMPSYEESFDNYRGCVANGWGKDYFGVEGRYAVILKKVEQDMVPHSRCNTLLKNTKLGYGFKLHNSFVCAGGEAGKDTCQGDGGAPLACPIGNDRYKLSGLVAWGIGCGQQDVPAVYVNVAAFRRWVDAQMAAWGMDAQCPRGNDRYKLTGLVAWGIGCGQKDVPAVYVNVAAFRRWVDGQMAAWGMDAQVYNIDEVASGTL